ncbi:MAG TPA: response regulator transcription factor [Trebonia sp.]
MTERILIAEDDPVIADSVAYSLRACGYHVDAVASGEAAMDFAPATYDLLILDLMLPGVSGVEVCRRVRERSAVSVLMLTALAGEVDRVVGLEAGADDYLSKPFSMAELVSRVRAILRRRELDREPDAVRRAGGLTLDLVGQTVLVDRRNVELTPSEFRLLALLAADPGRVFTRAEIARRLARDTAPADERACDVHVKNLRRKIEDDPARPSRVVTVRGVGYLPRTA